MTRFAGSFCIWFRDECASIRNTIAARPRQNSVMKTDTAPLVSTTFDISGKTSNPDAGLRGNYAAMAADFTVQQRMSDYTASEQARWLRLVERQLLLIPGRACDEFLDAVLGNPALDMRHGIPNFADVNVALKAATNWQLVAVPGLLPDDVFFTHLANRRFPVTVWLREERERSEERRVGKEC